MYSGEVILMTAGTLFFGYINYRGIGFAGARVIEQTIRETLPDGFQKAEYLRDHGMVDIVVNRLEMRGKLIKVLKLLLNKN